MRMHDANWMQIERYLEQDDRIVLPLGSTEQHGYLSLETDNILAERVSAEAAEPLEIPVLPSLPYGLTPYFAAYPGSPSLRVGTYVAVVRDLLDSLHGQGFRRFLLVNGHPGSAGALQAACAQAHAELPDSRCLLVSWWKLPEVQSLVLELFGAREGHHATPGELSVVQRFYPRAVLELPPMERFEAVQQMVAWGAQDFRRRYPDGRVGSDPSLASASAGDRIFAAASRALAEAHLRLVEDQ